MKKYILGIFTLFLALTLTACGNKTAPTIAGHKIAGESYKGTHIGSDTTKDPDYEYLISFKRNGTFRKDITTTNGRSSRLVEIGKYKVNAKKKQLTIKVNKLVETSYQDDKDVKNNATPSRYSYRSGKKLTKEDSKAVTIKVKKEYLVEFSDKTKLYKTKSKPVDFNKFKKEQAKKYQNSPQAKAMKLISGRSFAGQLDKNDNWITFNDDGTYNFKSLYNSVDGSIEYLSGNYNIDDKGNVVFTNTTGAMYDMYNLDVQGNSYNDVTMKNTFDERMSLYLKNNRLHIKSDAQDSLMPETSARTPSFESIRKTMKKIEKKEWNSPNEISISMNTQASTQSGHAHTKFTLKNNSQNTITIDYSKFAFLYSNDDIDELDINAEGYDTLPENIRNRSNKDEGIVTLAPGDEDSSLIIDVDFAHQDGDGYNIYYGKQIMKSNENIDDLNITDVDVIDDDSL